MLDTDSDGLAATAVALVGAIVINVVLFAGLIAWGVMPLCQALGLYPPFWPLLFTALLIRLILAQNKN